MMGTKPTIHLNKAELLRRKQALIRQGQKLAFTGQVKRPTREIAVPFSRNTPQGASKPSAKFLKHYDSKQKAAERGQRMRDAGKPLDPYAPLIPKDVLLAHAVHITRNHLGLKRDKLIRDVPTIERPKPVTRHRTRPSAKELGLTLAEAKVYAKMSWYKPGLS